MKRPVIYALVIVAVLLLLLLITQLGGGASRHNWQENYKAQSESPYGTKVIYEMLGGYFPEYHFKNIQKNFVEDLPENPSEPANYVFIGEALYLDSADVQRLLHFISNGNTAFISSKSVPYDFMFYTYFLECDYAPWNDYSVIRDTMTSLTLQHSDLSERLPFEYKYIVKHRAAPYDWNYIDDDYFCGMETGFVSLGTMEVPVDEGEPPYYTNFAKMPYKHPDLPDSKGGTIYFHTQPLVFTNLQMLDAAGKEYADIVFSHLEKGDIYWDHYSQVGEAFSRRLNQRRSQNPNMSMSGESPLNFILNNRHLSWAWFTLLGMGILFLMFRAKRKQRVVPIIEPNTNTSLEHISTMSELYYAHKNHKKICILKMRNFLAMVRTRFGISTQKMDEKFAQQLGRRIGVEEKEIREVIDFYSRIKKSNNISDEVLRTFYSKIETLYTKCK